MSQLCHTCNATRWYPSATISKLDPLLHQIVSPSDNISNDYEIRRNIAYNLQYLEYLDLTIKELNLSDVLLTQSYKTFIITGISIVEAIFYSIIHKQGKQTKKSWEEAKSISSNVFKTKDGNECKILNTVLIKLDDPNDSDM